jgi:non-ribosomal peptide synthetase component F
VVAESDRRRAVTAAEALLQAIVLEPGDRVAFHLGENPSQEFIDAAKAAVLEAWGDEVPVLFVAGPTVVTIVRGVEKEL